MVGKRFDAAHTIEVDQPERLTGLVSDFLERGEAFLVNNRTVTSI
jgi:hypothetical protein